MAEEPTPAPDETQVQDTPAPESAPQPEAGTRAESETQDWEARYKDLQAEFTRKSQALSEFERQNEQQQQQQQLYEAVSNPDTQDQTIAALVAEHGPEQTRAYLESLGFEFEDQPEATDEQGRDPAIDYLLSREEQRQVEQVEADLYKQVEQVATDKQFELPDQLKEHVVDHMLMYQTTPEQAFEAVTGPYSQARETAIKEYRESKKSPAPPVRGQSGTEQVPLNDQASRLQRANEIAQQAVEESLSG